MGRGWRVLLEPGSEHDGFVGRGSVPQEIVLQATSLKRAEYAAELLLASDSLAHGVASLLGDELPVMAEDPPTDPAKLEEHHRFMGATRAAASGLTLAAIIAARASHHRKYQYALFKMRLSYHLCSVHIMDLDPSHWWPQTAVSDSPAHHVALAYALQTAYSAIEEIGLEVRASAEQPSRINGRWNPVVLERLQRRLRRAHIDLSESLIWHRRDTPTSVERAFPAESIRRAPWAYGKIRDVEIRVEDAISQASRLRSKVAAHRLPTIVQSLTPYDVTNVQHVARRLILESLGCWRKVSPR